MLDYMKYGPFICIGFVLMILFIIWVFCESKEYEFVGITPLLPGNLSGYTGTFVNITRNPSQSFPEIIPDQEELISQPPLSPSVCINEDFYESPQEISIPVPEVKSSKKGKFVSKGERMCREIMEKLYGVPFASVRPDWLRNPETGEKLELDCYNEELKLAVEYNGIQHYSWPNFTNQSQEQFVNQIRRDSFKMDVCDKNGVYLIVVPYTVKHEEISSYIISHLPETMKKINGDQQF